MRKHGLFLLFVAIFTGQVCWGQVTMNFKGYNPYKFLPEHSWNLVVGSSLSKDVGVILIGEAYNRKGNMLFKIESDAVTLRRGINNLSALTTPTRNITYFDAGIEEWVNTNHTLPPGNYRLCVYMECATPDCDGIGSGLLSKEGMECIEIKLELPTPLLLNYPGDRDSIDQTRPMLTWIWPTPGGGELLYRLVLSEKTEDRSCKEILLTDRPLMDKEGMRASGLQYPGDLDELEKGQTYCWHVEGYYSEEKVCYSEVWEFTVRPDTIIKKVENFNYIKLKDHIPKQDIELLNFLRVIYKEQGRQESKLNMSIRDSKGRSLYEESFSQVFGDNYLNIDLRGKGLKPGQSYSAVFTDSHNTSFTINFKFDFSY